MAEEVNMRENDTNGYVDEDRVLEWEVGLPSLEDIMPLSQLLIPPELASAFSLSPEPSRTIQDVNRASQSTLALLRGGAAPPLTPALTGKNINNSNNNFNCLAKGRSTVAVEEAEMDEEEDRVGSGCGGGSDSKKSRKTDGSTEEAESAAMRTMEEDPSEKSSKRPRLVWTPQLHKRFVDVVGHLGIKNAVPKTIMQLMNVEGLTRENVASHLQKYRLYLKRMHGLSSEGPSSFDHIFASTPIPPQTMPPDVSGSDGAEMHGNGAHMMPIPVPYTPQMMPMPMQMPVFGHMGMQAGNQVPIGYHQYGHDHYHQHHGSNGGSGFKSNPYMIQQRDWSGNNYGSVASYPPVGGGSNRED